MRVPEKYLKPYDHTQAEPTVYRKWESSRYFNPDTLAAGDSDTQTPSFSIVLPPPNVTGTLHTGHALGLTIEDIMVRFHRMNGNKTLWLPGTDHAAIATQSKVEKELAKDGVRKHDLGRDAFLEKVREFAQNSHDTIVNQVKKMGASVDWSREAYTLDEQRSVAVRTVFKMMYEDGLIYRGEKIVNWDPKGQTTISDDEIVYQEEKTKFYYLKYGPFTIGTARPETKFGDKYVVMHPDDKRYEKYKHGDTLEIEWINGPITTTIIKDESIDMEFGTGVMTITPWHSAVDFQIAEKHKLDKEQIIDQYGKLLPVAQEFAGIKITEAREKILEKLKEKGLFIKEEDYTHNIATAERTGGIIEPQIMKQWFIAVDTPFTLRTSHLDGIKSGATVTLKQLMRHVVEKGLTEILPERFEKTYFHWIDNLHDWNISRQIWFGHQIPVWYRSTNAHGRQNGTPSDSRGVETYVGIEPPEGNGWEQDPDTLDTWFSSGLWTFSTLGWPLDDARGKPTLQPDGTINPESDLGIYHPTSVLETGYDILFFWVARMILMTTYTLGTIPFKTVYLHGLVRDKNGRKMSKSLGNIIDPLDLIETYGTDALRMSFIVGNGPGNDLNLSEDKIRAYRKFANKLWNITRFVLEQTEETDDTKPDNLSETDTAYIQELETLTANVTNQIKEFKYHFASDNLYHYVWHTFADIILEQEKKILSEGNETEKTSARYTLRHILRTSLILLHPFMPFITEEIWQDIKREDDRDLIVTRWPLSK
ncbi:MAG: valine--tRNA ligase [Candidatus Zambryskibacteria bacterium CG10_big_fil_rev_8_21_14_0_10_42_12]|uniref:Valine--tRNA ligase n=1 Tax=Candidatus Zambryskibacteria bacterium CG10_big_fil_rev_8_21_14_0_10_42_12 TaxID=1975115 RepID=A0A2H0QW73_9BACT|nr:MAG: valine--tRNA ligase [Candidatus Zambryskibacteria bacterium CG10_big_fil_rev_8_21_14_0_10_42_12]